MKSFSLDTRASRVIFGDGALAKLGDETRALGCGRIMAVTTARRGGILERASALLDGALIEVFAEAVPHVPVEVAAAATARARAANIDCLVALGGGTAIGAAKAVALDLRIPIVAVPTTYGGSEMTPIWGLTRNSVKETGRSPHVQPRVVIYDPCLTLDLPRNTTVCSGMNAIAHCVEALYAADANPLTSSAALEGLRLLGRSLAILSKDLTSLDARADALEGSWLAGFSLGTVQMGLHHRLCHTLGGSFGLPHAETHAVLIPYVAAFNSQGARDAMSGTARALRSSDAPMALLDLARTIGAPRSLAELGMPKEEIETAAALTVDKPYPNPRAATRADLTTLLTAAWKGDHDYVSSTG